MLCGPIYLNCDMLKLSTHFPITGGRGINPTQYYGRNKQMLSSAMKASDGRAGAIDSPRARRPLLVLAATEAFIHEVDLVRLVR